MVGFGSKMLQKKGLSVHITSHFFLVFSCRCRVQFSYWQIPLHMAGPTGWFSLPCCVLPSLTFCTGICHVKGVVSAGNSVGCSWENMAIPLWTFFPFSAMGAMPIAAKLYRRWHGQERKHLMTNEQAHPHGR